MKTPQMARDRILKLLKANRYADLSKLGESALVVLKEVIEGRDPFVAAKAVNVVARIKGEAAAELLASAARRRVRIVRATVAAIAPELGESGRPILEYLLKSKDASVRKWAIRSAGRMGGEGMQVRLEKIRKNDPLKDLRTAAAAILEAAEPS